MGSDRPDVQAVHPRAKWHKGFGLIPVDTAGETVGVGSEVAREEKIGGNGVEGTVNKDMTKDGTIFEAHTQIVKPLSLEPHVCSRVKCATRKMCACVRTVRFSLYTPPSRSWQLPLSGRETARKNNKHLTSAQDYEWRLDSGEFDNG